MRRACGNELREEPHALRLARLSLREKPERSVHVEASAGRSHSQRVGISDKAGQYRHAKPLPHRRDLRLAVRGLEWNPRGADLALARPIGDTILAHDDPPDGIGRPARHVARRSRDM